MTEKAEKILSIVNEHPEYSQYASSVQQELEKLEELDSIDPAKPLQGYLLSSYRRIQNGDAQAGSNNRFNSVIAYLMKLTNRRPTESFHSEERRTYVRSGLPDIDMDIDYLRRGEVLDYVISKYGEENVAHIGTVQTLKTKASVRRAIKVLDPTNSIQYDENGKRIKSEKNFNFALENEILDSLPKILRNREGKLAKDIKETCQAYPKFKAYMDQYPEVYRIASAIEGTISGWGCLSKDTAIKTNIGWIRIDEIGSAVQLCYIDQNKEQKYTRQFLPHKTGKKVCYNMRLSNGDFIKVTDEHSIFTDQGCVRFEEIRKKPEQYKVLSIRG